MDQKRNEKLKRDREGRRNLNGDKEEIQRIKKKTRQIKINRKEKEFQ